MALVPTIKEGDWTGLRQAIQKLATTKLGSGATPIFAGLSVQGNATVSTLDAISAVISSLTVSSAFTCQTAIISSLTVTSAFTCATATISSLAVISAFTCQTAVISSLTITSAFTCATAIISSLTVSSAFTCATAIISSLAVSSGFTCVSAIISSLTVAGNIASSGSAGIFTTPSYNTTGWKTVTVTFPTAFAAAPKVVITRENLATGDFAIRYDRIESITTTGFTIVFDIVSVGTAGTTKYHWIAIQ